ncbi:MAG: hypothetical protein KAY09_03465 [Nitrospira sp.]|nr:hypothetical protein [Nitrospira sp.]
MNDRRRLLGSFTHGSMANALLQVIGAQLTHPDRQVITLSGDGGLAMLMGDCGCFGNGNCRSSWWSSRTTHSVL